MVKVERPLWWRISVPVLVVLLVFAGIVSIWLGLPLRAGNPMDASFLFRYPKSVHAGLDGNVWVLDKGQRRIIKINKDNEVEWIVNGSRRGKDTIYKAWIIGSDRSGTLWIQNILTNLDEDTTEREEILSIHRDGSFGPIVDSRDYDKETRSNFYNAMTFLQFHNVHIYYFYPLGNGISELTDIDTETGKVSKKIVLFDCLSYAAIEVASDNVFYLLDKRGNLFESSSDGKKTIFSPNSLNEKNQLRMPINMVRSSDVVFSVLDAKNRIVDIYPDGKRTVRPLLEKQKISFPVLSVNNEGVLSGVDEFTSSPIILMSNGMHRIISETHYSLQFQIKRWSVWVLLSISLIALCYLFVLIYIHFFKRRIPLIIKQLIIFIPLILAAVIAISVLIYNQMSHNLETQINNNLLLLSQIGARQLDINRFSRLNPTVGLFDDFISSADYEYFKTYMNDFINGNADSWNSSTYAYVYRKYGSDWYILAPWDYVELFAYPLPEFSQVLDDGLLRVVRYNDVYGSWYSAFAPLKDESGNVIAVFEVTINGLIFDQLHEDFLRELSHSIFYILILLIVSFSSFTWVLLLSLKSLHQGANQITGGNYELEIGIHSRDELEDLGVAFNRMSREIQKQIRYVTDLNRANSKFVPAGLLSYLGKKSILEIKLGDHTQGNMSILFCDIRGFTGISEKMNPDENFSFINEYLELMSPVIRQQKGFIDKFVGDEIMAVFPENSDDALLAAMEMLERLDLFNRQHQDRSQLFFGIGIHTGPVMMGIVGEEERYEGTVIADAVNLASRLEGLTKQYGVSVIVSDETLRSLKHPEAFDTRLLDMVRVQGKQKPSIVHEIISPLDPYRDYKMNTREIYLEAFDLYHKKNFSRAIQIFESLMKICPEDKAVESLMRRSIRLQSEGSSATWDGIIELREK